MNGSAVKAIGDDFWSSELLSWMRMLCLPKTMEKLMRTGPYDAAKTSPGNRKDYVLSGMGRKWVEGRRKCLALKTLKTTVNRLLTLLKIRRQIVVLIRLSSIYPILE